MKLLTTIAAVLISISAFSQDLIEYDNYSFSRNGESLTMEEIGELTVIYNVGKKEFIRANNLLRYRVYSEQRTSRRAIDIVGALVLGGFNGFFAATAPDYGSSPTPYLIFGVAGATPLLWDFSRSSYDKVNDIAERNFKKVADKINQAIAAGGPTAPSSNQ